MFMSLVVYKLLEKFGEMFYCDFCIMNIFFVGGVKYFIMFKDDCISYRFMYCIKMKFDVY